MAMVSFLNLRIFADKYFLLEHDHTMTLLKSDMAFEAKLERYILILSMKSIMI